MIDSVTLSDKNRDAITRIVHSFQNYDMLNNPDDAQLNTRQNSARQLLTPIFQRLDIQQKIQELRSDHSLLSALIIRNMPCDVDLLPAPKTIPEAIGPSISYPIMLAVAALLNKPISTKGFNNTIRFVFDGVANVEPWHNHSENSYTIFYCHREDANAKTLIFDVTDACLQNPYSLALWLKPMRYIDNEEEFPLITCCPNGYQLSSRLLQFPFDTSLTAFGLNITDVFNALKTICDNNNDPEQSLALQSLIDAFSYTQQLTYRVGDLAIFNEQTTLRYSDSYTPQFSGESARFLQTLSVQ